MIKRFSIATVPLVVLLASGIAWAQQQPGHTRANGAQPATSRSPASATPPTAAAETEARAHFDRGLALFNVQDYNGALAEFQAAYDLSHRPSILYNIGVAHQALHHYPEAARAIEQHLREATLTPERRAQVEHGLNEIREFIAHITIIGLPDGASVRIDGQLIGNAPIVAAVPVGTGQHVVDVRADGFEDGQERVLIAGGQTREVRFALRASRRGSAAATGTQGMGLPATLDVRDAPAGSTVEIDGQRHPAEQPITLEPGDHNVRVLADGYAPWSGRLTARAGMRQVAHVHMARSGRWGPAPFGVGVGLTIAAGIGAVIFGVLTLNTHARFVMLTQEDPTAQTVANEGNMERAVTNVLLGVTVVAAAASVYFFTRTSFGATQSMVDVAIAPRLDGGAEGAVRVRF